MLIHEKIKETSFSPAEKDIIDFILSKQEAIEHLSTTQIAEETHTSPSMLIRIANKLDFDGYTAFKRAYLKEVQYLQTNFQSIDANFPFDEDDHNMTIANKVVLAKKESLSDTLLLLDTQQLEQVIERIDQAKCLKVFTIANNTFLAEEFVFKMRHIGKLAETFSVSNTMIQEAAMSSKNDCAIIISYSGESSDLFKTIEILKKKRIPIIAITSIGENTVSNNADITLHITTREKSYSKIGAYTSLESISAILDIIYSCYFNTNYQQHYAYKQTLSRVTEDREIKPETLLDN